MKYLPLLLILICPFLHLSAQKLTKKEKKGKYAFFLDKKQVTEYTFDEVLSKWGGHTIVGVEGRYGLMNRVGEVIVPAKYESLRFARKDAMLAKQADNYGAIDTLGNELLAFKYERIDYFLPDSVALVKLDGKWGVLKNNAFDPDAEMIFKSPEELPLFKGTNRKLDTYEERKKDADTKMLTYIFENIRYPQTARTQKVEGMVVVSFVVTAEGETRDPRVVREIGGGCGAEVQRLVKQMPKWIPGMVDGKPVATQFNLPVKFKLE
ncbi:TonB family protein [Neolewinella persica]|uniref:TonB family protein n=1 Tax=Neolewinella persica TaxID=70998 RepID=UPI00146EFD54|nr:TonB family protein [Neolewinella persica]